MRARLSFLFVALIVAAPSAADVVDSKTERQLSLPGANFRVVVPREDWLIVREQTRSDVRSVYYALTSAKRDMALWVFIDQTPVCQSAKACLELAMKNKAYDGAKDMTFAELEGFNIVQFTLEPSKEGPKQRHLVAATYVDGAWVDLHLFQAVKSGEDPAALLAVLKLVAVR